eukprot:EG_transcript_20417
MVNNQTSGGSAPPSEADASLLRVGTWNMSHWMADKAALIASSFDVDILAVQETHLAPLPLEHATSSARRVGLHLHHGRPAVPLPHSEHSRSSGVGFLCREGVPVALALPPCPAWRRLDAMRRLHGVRLAPRPDLPRGLLLLSIYAPLHTQAEERACFDLALTEVVHTLDMQTPTLLLGDFNGSAWPARDYRSRSGRQRQPCALLTHLLGPGSPWVDVHAELLADPLPMTFHAPSSEGDGAASRIDLILANPSAHRLIRSAHVLEDIRDGGHSPVFVTLNLSTG